MQSEMLFDTFGEIDNRYILEADKVLHLSRGESRLRRDRLLQTAVLVTGALAMLAASYAAGAAGPFAHPFSQRVPTEQRHRSTDNNA